MAHKGYIAWDELARDIEERLNKELADIPSNFNLNIFLDSRGIDDGELFSELDIPNFLDFITEKINILEYYPEPKFPVLLSRPEKVKYPKLRVQFNIDRRLKKTKCAVKFAILVPTEIDKHLLKWSEKKKAPKRKRK